MFDTQSVYALNKVNKTAIVCPSVTGDHVHLAREDFDSEEEFVLWKAWSDEDYHKIEVAGQDDDRCLSLDAQRDAPAPSAEEPLLTPYVEADRIECKRRLVEYFKKHLTKTQYRRMCLYFLDGMNEREIAELEGVGQRRVSTSLTGGKKIVERFFKEFLQQRG